MARKKNATFQGLSRTNAVRDASIFRSSIENAVGDAALIFDKLTGENGHSGTDTINHSGSGRGCQLRMPLVNQYVGKGIGLAGGTAVNGESHIIAVLPVYNNANSSTFNWAVEMEYTSTFSDDVTVEVRSAAWALTNGPFNASVPNPQPEHGPFGGRSPATINSYRIKADVSLTSAAWQYIVLRRSLYTQDGTGPENAKILHLIVRPADQTYQQSTGSIPQVSTTGTTFPVSTSLTASTGSVATGDGIDAITLGNGFPLDAYVVSRTNRLINTMWEYITGSKIPGNTSRVLSTNRVFNRSSLTSEPLLEFPVGSFALSAVPVVCAEGTSGAKDYLTSSYNQGPINFVRTPTASITLANAITVSRAYLMMPSTMRTGASSDLAGRVLLCAYTGGTLSTNWRLAFDIGGNVSAYATPVQIDATNNPRLWSVSFSGLAYNSGAYNSIKLLCHNGGAVFGQQFAILGWSLAFTPP